MPTIIAARAGFDRARGRWTDIAEEDAAFNQKSRAIAFAAIVAAAFVVCVLCLASGAHPTPDTMTEFSVLLGP